jgi:hypothetical protein
MQVFLYIRESCKQLKRVDFVSDRVSYIKLRGLWCHIALNVHTPTKDEIDYVKRWLL